MSNKKVWVVLSENVGYNYLEKYFINVYNNLEEANREISYIKTNSKKKFLMLKKTIIRR